MVNLLVIVGNNASAAAYECGAGARAPATADHDRFLEGVSKT